MILLVVGADRVDAGKTTFSAGLLERVRLPPLRSDARDDPARIARAYEHAYDEVLDAVGRVSV